MDPIVFVSREAFRDWLEENHDSADELWVGYHKVGAPPVGTVDILREYILVDE